MLLIIQTNDYILPEYVLAMTERISVVLSDIDGTQVADGHPLPSKGVQHAAHMLRRNGIVLLESTGRPYPLLSPLVEPLDLGDNLCSVDGGATVVRANNENDILWSRPLDAKTTQTVIAAIGPLCIRVNSGARTLHHEGGGILAALENETVCEVAPSVFGLFDVQRGDHILAALSDIPNIAAPAITEYRDSAFGTILVVRGGVSKQHSGELMLEHTNLGDAAALAIGNDVSDMSLFVAVGPEGQKVAMGNSPDELKDLADWVAPSVDDDGFVTAMRHYDLI